MARKDAVFAIAATALVVAGLALGFRELGGRPRQRDLRTDAVRVNDLREIAIAIRAEWAAQARNEDRRLPSALAGIQTRLASARTSDPLSGAPYEYILQTGSQYQLCAVFATERNESPAYRGNGEWYHPRGRHCFLLDASARTPDALWLP